MLSHTTFQYKRGDVFNFAGDDDVWVFINKKLVVDLGGNHQTASANVNLDTLGLTPSQNYQFDFFYCERHTTQSIIKIETTLSFKCPFYDECGICQGDGTSCCTRSNCDDNPIYKNNCIDARCENGVCVKPVRSSPSAPCFEGICTPGVWCSMVSRNCSNSNHCTLDVCDLNTNACVHNVIPNCLNCQFTSCITTDPCYKMECSPDGRTCLTFEKDCSDNNFCTIDSCDFDTGNCNHIEEMDCKSCVITACYTTDKCFPRICSKDGLSCVNTSMNCDDNFFCSEDICLNGICQYILKPDCVNCEIQTTNKCEIQKCSADGRSCETEPKDCNVNGSLCDVGTCISPSGICEVAPIDCDDNDECSIDYCGSSGNCIHQPIQDCVSSQNINCITIDRCFPLICVGGTSCMNTTKTCDDGNACTIDECVSPSGICNHIPIDNCISCYGTPCITNDKCNLQVCDEDFQGDCKSSFKDCDDNNYCTIDTCEFGNCLSSPIGQCTNCNFSGCITSNSCFPQFCSEGACVEINKNCDDGNACSNDFCNEDFGDCFNEPIQNCMVCQTSGIACITTNPCKPMVCPD